MAIRICWGNNNNDATIFNELSDFNRQFSSKFMRKFEYRRKCQSHSFVLWISHEQSKAKYTKNIHKLLKFHNNKHNTLWIIFEHSTHSFFATSSIYFQFRRMLDFVPRIFIIFLLLSQQEWFHFKDIVINNKFKIAPKKRKEKRAQKNSSMEFKCEENSFEPKFQ